MPGTVTLISPMCSSNREEYLSDIRICEAAGYVVAVCRAVGDAERGVWGSSSSWVAWIGPCILCLSFALGLWAIPADIVAWLTC
jgi:hypothetical protein